MKILPTMIFVAVAFFTLPCVIWAQQEPLALPPLPSDVHPGSGSHSADSSNTQIALPAIVRPGQKGLFKAGKLSKAGSGLARLFAAHRAHIEQGNQSAFRSGNPFIQFYKGRVLVDASATGNGSLLLNDLKQLGLKRGSRYGHVVSGLLPIAMIEKAVALDSLRSISAARRPINHSGSITSQGDVALRADVARSTHGVDGTGVTVGVLSDSFDSLGGAAADIGSGDLPSSGVTVIGGESPYCGTVIFCIDEGRAMLQIVHDLAPGADLLFHTGLATTADYANAISALASAGADVIVDDLLYLNEPMFQDGIVAQAVDSVVAGGAAYYSAAGNAGRNSYEADFVDSGVIFCIEFFEPIGDCHALYERVGRMHDFDPGPGVDLYQSVTVPVDGVLSIALQWDEPFGGPGSKADYDIVLLDETGGIYYEISANDNVTTGEGWEVLQFQNHEILYDGATSYNVIITYDDVDSIGPPTNRIKTVVFGSGSTLNEHLTHSGTLFGHANAAGAVAVGASFFLDTPEFGTTPPLLESFSSAGGTPILFSSNGTPLAPVVRQKPEVTAVDGVNTTFFFNDSHGSDGIDDFFGTSAAAPHAAAVAALMLEAKGGATPAELKTALQNSAIDMEAPGFDEDSGFGLIQADVAIDNVLIGGGNAPPEAAFTYDCTGSSCTFDSSDSSDDVGITSYSWDFGDSGTSSDPNPSHTYTATGDYTVVLTVEDVESLSDTASTTVSIVGSNAPPVAAFTYECSALACTFDAAASSDDVGIVSYAWDFGDGNGSAAQNPSHTYSSQGNYTVTLTVEDVELESDTASATFRVKRRGNTSGSSGGGDGGGTTIEAEKGKKKCNDEIDNDGDGDIDAADTDCK